MRASETNLCSSYIRENLQIWKKKKIIHTLGWKLLGTIVHQKFNTLWKIISQLLMSNIINNSSAQSPAPGSIRPHTAVPIHTVPHTLSRWLSKAGLTSIESLWGVWKISRGVLEIPESVNFRRYPEWTFLNFSVCSSNIRNCVGEHVFPTFPDRINDRRFLFWCCCFDKHFLYKRHYHMM